MLEKNIKIEIISELSKEEIQKLKKKNKRD